MKPSVGRIVHYVLSSGTNKGEHRPALVVRVWSDVCVQLQVFTDATNDFPTGIGSNGLFWATSVLIDETDKKENTWHWPEKV